LSAYRQHPLFRKGDDRKTTEECRRIEREVWKCAGEGELAAVRATVGMRRGDLHVEIAFTTKNEMYRHFTTERGAKLCAMVHADYVENRMAGQDGDRSDEWDD
jgi:hypothetical protein